MVVELKCVCKLSEDGPPKVIADLCISCKTDKFREEMEIALNNIFA